MPSRLPRSRTLKGDPKIVYYEKGEGRPAEAPLVLVHGATFRSEDWENILPRLATRYRVVAYDQRGHGKSGRAADYGVCALADDLTRVLRDLVKTPAIVVGHSLGAAAALVAAVREPALFKGLVLEDPLLARYGEHWRADYFTKLRAALDHAGSGAAFVAAIGKLPLPVPGPRGERTAAEVRGFYAPERLATYFASLDPAFVDAFLAQAEDAAGRSAIATAAPRCPVLVLAADPKQGSALAPEELERFAASGYRIAHFPGVGHRIHGLRPEPFLEALEPFLRAHRGS